MPFPDKIEPRLLHINLGKGMFMYQNIGCLIVDDEELLRSALADLCKKRFYKVFEASTGEESIELVKSNQIDLVLMDLQLPGISGLEAIEGILKINPNALVIIQTGYGTEEHAKAALKLGAFDMLEKPVKRDLLLSCIERASKRIYLEKVNREILEYIVLQIDNISPEQYKALDEDQKYDLLNRVLGIIRMKRLNLLSSRS